MEIKYVIIAMMALRCWADFDLILEMLHISRLFFFWEIGAYPTPYIIHERKFYKVAIVVSYTYII